MNHTQLHNITKFTKIIFNSYEHLLIIYNPDEHLHQITPILLCNKHEKSTCWLISWCTPSIPLVMDRLHAYNCRVRGWYFTSTCRVLGRYPTSTYSVRSWYCTVRVYSAHSQDPQQSSVLQESCTRLVP